MNDIFKIIATKLRGLRAENGKTLEDVSEKLGIHRETLRRYESNPSNISIDMLIKLLNLYDIEVNIFFDSIYGKMPYKKDDN